MSADADEEMTLAEYCKPRALDLFCGPNVPLGAALLWCGWEVQPVDIVFGERHDLSNPVVQKKVMRLCEDVDMCFWAPGCSTFTRAREKRLPGGDGGPPILRTAGAVKGVELISGADKLRVERANNFAEFTFLSAFVGALKGNGQVIENPERSWIWEFPEAKRMSDIDEWRSILYDACVFAGARKKAQMLQTNVEELQVVQAKCCHVHEVDEWKLRCDLGGARRFATKEEAEYTAELAFAMAVALSMWAVRVGKASMRIPLLISPSAVGTRKNWAEADPQATRSKAMPVIAVRLGLGWPQNPPEWFKAIHGEGPKASRVMTQDVQEEDALCIYAGQSNLQVRKCRSRWSSPFVVGPHGDEEECMVKYARWFLGTSKEAEGLVSKAGAAGPQDCV